MNSLTDAAAVFLRLSPIVFRYSTFCSHLSRNCPTFFSSSWLFLFGKQEENVEHEMHGKKPVSVRMITKLRAIFD